jgi:hypothetical protein
MTLNEKPPRGTQTPSRLKLELFGIFPPSISLEGEMAVLSG